MTDDLGACPDCDLLYRRRPVPPGEIARCPRCGARLYRHSPLDRDRLLALVVAALITFVIANAAPIVEIRVQGAHGAATLTGTVAALWQSGREAVAVLVLVTTQVVPLLDLAAMLALLLAAGRGDGARPPWFGRLMGIVLALRPWGMIEVLLLGVLVSVVKLSSMADVVPGVALWAFAALTVMLAAIAASDPRILWDTRR